MNYWSDILRGDLGRSLSTLDQPVTEKIGNALPWTIGLLGTSVLLAFALGTALGAVLSWPRFSRFAILVGAPFLLTVAIPQYLLAVILVATFSVMLRWLPAAGGMSTITIAGFDWNTISDILRHAVLPASALVLGTIGFWAMGMRANMVSVLGSDYMTFAEAKGLRERTIFARYGVRNALLPQITSLALAVSTIVSGAILVEIVFNYPGLGGLLYSAISTKDYFVIQGITLILVIATATALFVLDLVYPFIDPRVRNQ